MVYQRLDMTPGRGCDKPVIYLYPQHTTKVNVQVGTDIVAAKPTYATNGWQGVIAQPNGSLTYRGQQYNDLYWEGYGYGFYPPITDGTIVTCAKVVPTIRLQMAEQGFKQNEIAAFLAYWEP